MKNEIVAKKYGRNLVVMIDGVKKTRVINTDKDKKDEKSIINKINLYNKKNNKDLKNEILYLVDTNKQKEDAAIAAKKGIKKTIKKEIKAEKAIVKEEVKANNEEIKSNEEIIKSIDVANLTDNDVNKLEDLLNSIKAKTKVVEPVVTASPRRGEY